MQAVWFKGVPNTNKDDRIKEIKSYRNAFDALKEILNSSDYKKKEAVRDYGAPNWRERQIAVNEYNRVLDDVINLITIEDK